jgi:prepilin-type N-terminal cleavage/methylation domain-containing protein
VTTAVRHNFAARPAAARRRGLTLIEVLATIVLVGIVLPVAMNGISLCLASASIARQRSEAASLAEAKLNELVATGDWQYGMASGDFGEAWPEYHWTAGTSTWSDPAVQQLSVRVFWVGRGQERDIILTTLVYQGTGTGTATGA